MRASSKTLLVALAMAGCSIYDETSGASSGGAAGASGSGGGSGEPSGGFSGTGASGAKDGSLDARGNADAGGAAGGGGTSGAAGSSGAAGGGGISGAAGTSGVDGAAGGGGTTGTGGTSGGAAGASGTSGAAGSSGADGSTGTDSSSGIDRSDAGQPCVTGTGPANLPFAVDQYFVSSGWMQPTLIRQDSTCSYPPSPDAGSVDAGRDGNVGADSATAADAPSDRDGSSMTDAGTVPPLPGSRCWTITYAPTSPTDWAGVDWQYPINNWGTTPGLVIPPGATRVSLVAWGETGSETVTFQVGYGAASTDGFGASLTNQILTTIPARYAVDMSGIAYTCNSVRMGFGWVAAGGTSMTFHIADIRWE